MLFIDITYSSSWRTSFLGASNSDERPKRGRAYRPYVATSTPMNNAYKKTGQALVQRDVTQDTVLGILYRLLGDPKKLCDRLKNDDHYLADVLPRLSFEDCVQQCTHETVFLRNPRKADNPASFAGMVNNEVPVLTNPLARDYFSVFTLSLDSVITFVAGYSSNTQPDLTPIDQAVRMTSSFVLDALSAAKEAASKKKDKDAVDFDARVASDAMQQSLRDIGYMDEQLKKISVENLYCAALKMRLNILMQDDKNVEILKPALNDKHNVVGISIRGLTEKNFKGQFSGGVKRGWGGPSLFKPRDKHEPLQQLRKSDGLLRIRLDVSDDRADEIKYLIEAAGVHTFRLGKKGLAYVSNLEVH